MFLWRLSLTILVQALSEQKTLTPVESLAQNNLIQDAITSYKISRLSDGKNDGEITFGGLDSTKFDPNTLVTFNNVNQQGFWEGAVSFSVDGQDSGLKGRTAILDTGTTLIVAPQADAETIHSAIPGAKTDGQGGFTIPCTSTASVALTFSGQTFEIQPEDLLFTPVDPNDLTGDCVSGISSGNIGGATEWLVSVIASWFKFPMILSSFPRSATSSSRTLTSPLMSPRTRSPSPSSCEHIVL